MKINLKNIFSKRPDFFDEMQQLVSSILLPIGFEEKVGPRGLARQIEYLRGEHSVTLWLDVRDSIYYLDVASTKSTTTEQIEIGGETIQYGAPVLDFRIEGHISEANNFKNEAITKLNKWLFEKGIK